MSSYRRYRSDSKILLVINSFPIDLLNEFSYYSTHQHDTPMGTEMSDIAKSLLHYAANYREGCADDSDRTFCFHAAREYAAHLITSL